MKNLENKVIVVTGGSGLLGTEMVRELRSGGAKVVNFDINLGDDLDQGTMACDITDNDAIRVAFGKVKAHFGKIDGLINNAYPRTRDWGTNVEEIDPASWRQNVDWQLNSYFFCCQTVLGYMKEQGFGSVVNIASIYGVVGNDFTIYENTTLNPPAAYAAIKGGLINLTRYLASYFGKYNVRVNCLSPGGIFDHQSEPFVKAYEHKVPMKRLGRPDDIAPVAAFLVSDASKYITGQNLIVDGGWTAI